MIQIQPETTKDPISLMGREAGVCWGREGNDYKRGLDCIKSGHGRVMEYPQVYMVVDASARMIRELYTHIGGSPTRLQASTRYIDYKDFDVVVPPSIEQDAYRESTYRVAIDKIVETMQMLECMGVPREDIAMLLPLGMVSRVVLRTNLRNLADMSRQRMCNRAYWEFRQFMLELTANLEEYSEEWRTVTEMCFMPKCEHLGYCPEIKSCGMMPQREG